MFCYSCLKYLFFVTVGMQTGLNYLYSLFTVNSKLSINCVEENTIMRLEIVFSLCCIWESAVI